MHAGNLPASCSRRQRQPDDRPGAAGRVLPEDRFSAVSGSDLFHNVQPQNVRGVFARFRRIQRRQHCRGIPCTIVCHREAETLPYRLCPDADPDRGRVVPDAVVQQVVQQPPQQGAVGLQQCLFCRRGLGQGKRTPLCQRAFIKLRHQLPEQRPGG